MEKSEINTLLQFFPQGLVAVDLETTGLSPLIDKIIEIAAVKLSPDGKLTSYSSLVDPEIPIPELTTKIHGIEDSMVSGAPKLKEIFPEFLKFWGDTDMVAHNAKFDLGFIVYFALKNNFNVPKVNILDSLAFSRHGLSGAGKPENNKLSTLVKHFNIPLLSHHRALDDAVACMRVFAKSLLHVQDRSSAQKVLKNKALIFNLKSFHKNASFEIPKSLLGLKPKVETQQVVEIEYLGGTIRNQYRPIRPLSFMPLPGGPVLNALCLLSFHYKNFSLKKIRHFKEPSEEQIDIWLAKLSAHQLKKGLT